MAEGGGDRNPWWNDPKAYPSGTDVPDSSQAATTIGNQTRILVTSFIHDRLEADGATVPQQEMFVPQTPSDPAQVGLSENERVIAGALKMIGDQLDGDDRLQSLLEDISPEAPMETFLCVAKKIFEDGKFNWGRVVMLFYFAYKMAKKAIGSVGRIGIIRKIVEWIVKFVKDYVAGWIISRGGWSQIQEYFGSTTGATVGVFLAGCLTAALVYRYKSG